MGQSAGPMGQGAAGCGACGSQTWEVKGIAAILRVLPQGPSSDPPSFAFTPGGSGVCVVWGFFEPLGVLTHLDIAEVREVDDGLRTRQALRLLNVPGGED